MLFSVLITESAQWDLADIWNYIAENDAPSNADYVVGRIEETIFSLEKYPNRGVFCRKGIREVFFKPYRVIYTVDEPLGEVSVLIVADGRRDIEELLNRKLPD